MNHVFSAFALSVCLAIVATFPSVSLAQSAPSRHKVEFVRIYAADFETGENPMTILTPGVALTTAASEVVSGMRSVKLDGGAVFAQLPTDAVALQPGRYYMLSLRYRMLRPGRVGLVLRSPGAAAEFTMLGELPLSPLEDSLSWSIWVPGVSAATVLFYALDATITFDDILLEAQTPMAWRASLPMITSGFPRLGDYMLLGPRAIADMHGDNPADAERTAARFDLLVGSGSDHTQGGVTWIRRVRALNPSLLVLPYRQAYMAQFDGSVLHDEFNTGLADEWFMRSTTSNRLAEPMFPMNVQLDHTLLAPAVGGQTLADYSTSFLRRRVLGSGLWDGVQFDQAEWYINPLLGEPPPLIDLDRDGAADPPHLVQREWARGFVNYFRTVNRQFGHTQLSMGNAGYLAANPSALAALNGWIAERVEPYRSDAAGNWITSAASDWYRLLNNYLLAGRVARAPQLPLLEFTGTGLGTPTGELTPNGVPMRSRQMTAADYRRMRLGLTTALLGNGYFEYDLVDNTTPALWFDEYAVNAGGAASTLLSSKGYLGQPLGDAEELAYPSRVVFDLDFETPSLPASAYVNGRVTTVPSEVIAGSSSLVVTKASITDFAWFIWSEGQVLPGRTYQLSADYRILTIEPVTHHGLTLGFVDESGHLPTHRTGSLLMPDVDGPGQQGTLRASIKATMPDPVAGILLDVGSVAIDNVRLVEGTGGVWRRDFEKGIVLVNPTPEPLTVSLAQIAGARQRTGIKRILGTQQPAWNSGQPVSSAGIVIPSGDGILLLANSISVATLGAAGAPVLTAATDAITAHWSPAAGYPAGYQILYGEDPAHLTRVAAAGRDARVTLEHVLPGATYYVSVAAYDFKGNLGPPSALRSVVTAGVAPPARPVFSLYSSALVPGAIAIITGTALADSTVAPTAPYPTRAAGTRIEVNGVEAPLYWVSPTAIAFVTPWDVAGPDAAINVIRGSAVGQERLVPMRAALPQLLTWAAEAGSVIAFHQDGTPVTATTPASRGEVIDVFALNLGAVTVAPDNGVPPPSSWIAATVDDPIVTVGGIAATTAAARLEPNMVGVYRVTITIPATAPAGLQPMRLGIAGEDSNILAIAIQ